MASMSALFLNKIGDLFFMLAIVLAIGIFSDLSLSTIFSLIAHLNGDLVFLLSLCFIGAAAAKSALIPLHSWLPKAMEGPTSVSALLHSSTMVTAGCYLLIRISPILEFSSTSLMIIVWLGSLGALFGAACGMVDNDLKRVIAMSTNSQLGYMIVAVGVSQYS
jgi:NADH-ubiquinone oxidoreductase chain 5